MVIAERVETPTATGRAGRPRIARVESLRALAALAVLVTHCWQVPRGYGASAYDTWYGKLMAEGSFGVWIFFALTGYLLGRPFLARIDAPEAGVRLRRYARNRALRILPLYYAVLAAVLLLRQHGGTWQQWLSYATFTENWRTAPVEQVDGPMWSLIVEAQFYLLLPLFAWLLVTLARGSRRRAAVLLIAGTAALAAVREAFAVLHPELMSLDWRRSLLVTGVFFFPGLLLALVRKTDLERLPCLLRRDEVWLAAAVAFFVPLSVRLSMGDLLMLPVAFFLVGMCALPLRRGVWCRILDSRALALLGLISYGIYLIHVPVLQVLLEHPGWWTGMIPLTIVVLTASVVLASASYRWVERPFLRQQLPWKFNRAAGASPAATGSLPFPREPAVEPLR